MVSNRFTSSFNGNITEIPQISVDNFEKLDKKAYFLSHCHSDHTHGLYSAKLLSSLEKTGAIIYMSEISASIVKHESNFNEIEKYVKPLKLGWTPIIIPGDKDTEEIILNVTLIPAGHCFGSVMFLFKINSKTILYTGDFRMNSNDITKYGQLHVNGEPIIIDSLYVDTTFQNESHDHFPKRSETVQEVIAQMKLWLNASKDNRIALHTSAKYGYEYVFEEIYKSLNMKVYVDDYKWKLYRQFEKLLVGVTINERETTIHLCKNRNENMVHTNCFDNGNMFKYLFVHFSAMIWKNYGIDKNSTENHGNRINVCFATHCSRQELLYFIQYLNPKEVIGFPEPYIKSPVIKNIDVNLTPPKRKMTPTKSIHVVKKPKKVCKNLLNDIFG